MSEEKSIRIAKAASEFNVSLAHIVDLLKTKGFSVEAKPTSKITEEMYTILLKEFGRDKDLKDKADSLNIGIGRKLEKEQKEKEDAEVVVKPEPEPVVEAPKKAAEKKEKEKEKEKEEGEFKVKSRKRKMKRRRKRQCKEE